MPSHPYSCLLESYLIGSIPYIEKTIGQNYVPFGLQSALENCNALGDNLKIFQFLLKNLKTKKERVLIPMWHQSKDQSVAAAFTQVRQVLCISSWLPPLSAVSCSHSPHHSCTLTAWPMQAKFATHTTELPKLYPPQYLHLLYLFIASLPNWIVSSMRQTLCTPHLSEYHHCLPPCLALKYLMSEWLNERVLLISSNW